MLSTPTPDVLLAHSFFLCHDAKQMRKMKPYPPLATLLAGAVLIRQGHTVELFDATLATGVDAFAELVQLKRPPVVAILEDNFNFLTKMCTIHMRDAAHSMIAASKAAGARVVVNGSDASDVPQLYFDAGADVVIIGETEQTLPELLERWSSDSDLSSVAGLALPCSTGDGGAFTRTRTRSFVEQLDNLPMPAWQLVEADSYQQAWVEAHGRSSWIMAATRGCPFECNWCAKPLYGQRYAHRSPDNVAQELEKLKLEVKPDHVWFADDIFGMTRGWIESLAECIERRHASIPFTVQSRVDLMTESACEAYARAGCEEVWLGVESGAQCVLDAMDKGITVQQIRDATRRLKAHGIRPSWFLQIGYPGEEWTEIMATRELIREQAPHDIGVSVSYPLPGTRFHDQVQAQLKEKRNWTDSDDLDILFSGAFQSSVYRQVRDLLHDEANVALMTSSNGRQRRELDGRWLELGRSAGAEVRQL